jgi:hypothetical protein
MLLLPGWTHVDLGPDGGPYDEMHHPKGCIHTTEGTSLAGAENAFRSYPPHLGYDPAKREKHQYVSLDRHSYSLRKDESDDEYVIQIEIVGFAAQTHLWDNGLYKNIAEDVIKPLRDTIGILDNYLPFYGEDAGFILASANSPIRISDSQLRSFSGWLGHQHMPAPDEHWDPGKFNIELALNYVMEIDMGVEWNEKYTHGRTGLNLFYGDWIGEIKDTVDGVLRSTKELSTKVDELSKKVDELASKPAASLPQPLLIQQVTTE